MEDEDAVACPVCLEAVTVGDPGTLRLPGCGHQLHVSCALNAAQYDARCPSCRAVPDGVRPQQPWGNGGGGAVTTTTSRHVLHMNDDPNTISFVHMDGSLITLRMSPMGRAPLLAEQEEADRQLRRLRRNYLARRRRLFAQNHALHDDHNAWRDLRAQVDAAQRNVQRCFRTRCRQVWRDDSEVAEERAALRRLRRREARVASRVREALRETLGPPPADPDEEDLD